jgi:FtsH-binding integral membrane protein
MTQKPEDEGLEKPKPNKTNNIKVKAANENVNKKYQNFFVFSLFCLLVISSILSNNPILYFLGSLIFSGILFIICRFVGFFVKRDLDYYNNEDSREEDV